jgi:hypothetical protein
MKNLRMENRRQNWPKIMEQGSNDCVKVQKVTVLEGTR